MRLSRISPGAVISGYRRGLRGPAVLGILLLAGCAGPSTPPVHIPAPVVTGSPVIQARPDLRVLPEATTFTDVPAAPRDPAPAEVPEGVVLHVVQDVAVYDAPEGRAIAKLPATQLGSPTWVPQISERDEWSQILLPSSPNGSTGWVRTGDAPEIQKAQSPYIVDIDVDARRMVIRDQRGNIGSWPVGVGKPETPTPKGRTFILASIEDTVTKFSPVNLPLGTHSRKVTTDGRTPLTVALHGWPDPSVFGRESSDGCVRVPAEALRLLISLPLGTLVLLR